MVTSFQFTIAADHAQAKSAILDAARRCKCNPREKGSEIEFKMSPGFGYYKVSFSVYISIAGNVSTVRIMLQGNDKMTLRLKVYDKFLLALINLGADINVTPGAPYIVSAVMIGNGTEQRIVNHFGGVANNLSRARMKTVLSSNVLFRVFYSNGMVEEKEVKRDSKLYAELMSKLHLD